MQTTRQGKAKGKTKQETRKEGKRLGQEPQEEGIHLRIENLTRQGKSRTDANLTNLKNGTVKKVWRHEHIGLGNCTVLDKSSNVSILTKVKRIVKREESRSSSGESKWKANVTKSVPRLKK